MFLRLFPVSSSIELSDVGDCSGSGTDFLASGESLDVDRGWWTRGGRFARRLSNAVGDTGMAGRDDGMGMGGCVGERGSG